MHDRLYEMRTSCLSWKAITLPFPGTDLCSALNQTWTCLKRFWGLWGSERFTVVSFYLVLLILYGWCDSFTNSIDISHERVGDLVKAEGELSAWLNKRGLLTICNDSKFSVRVASTDLLARNEEQVSICSFVDWHPLHKKGSPDHFGLVEKVRFFKTINSVPQFR